MSPLVIFSHDPPEGLSAPEHTRSKLQIKTSTFTRDEHDDLETDERTKDKGHRTRDKRCNS